MLSAQGKGLARGTARDEIDLVLKRFPLLVSHVTFFDIPAIDKWEAIAPVRSDGVAGPLVPLDNPVWLETGQVNAHGKTARTRKQLYAFHASHSKINFNIDNRQDRNGNLCSLGGFYCSRIQRSSAGQHCTFQHNIRMNEKWRVCFVWAGDGAYDVEIMGLH